MTYIRNTRESSTYGALNLAGYPMNPRPGLFETLSTLALPLSSVRFLFFRSRNLTRDDEGDRPLSTSSSSFE